MKHTFLFSVVFLCLLISGCSTKNINSNQTFQQTCNANPVNNNENQEKQCCLKDSLETRIKHIEEICILKDPEQPKDSASDKASPNITISPTIPLDFSKKNKIHGQLDYNNKEISDSRKGCFGANCQINNIHIENKKEYKEEKSIKCQSLKECIIELGIEFIILIIVVNIVGTLIPYGYGKHKQKKASSSIKSSKKSANPYLVLSPTKNAEISDETKKQLTFAIIDSDNSEIKNIAITGPYGSGKSSVWQTFCENNNIYNQKNIVEISLAKFSKPNEIKIQTDGKTKLNEERREELEIERAIIQQLIYSKLSSDLKYSNFPRINNLKDKTTLFLTILSFTFISLVLALTNNTIFCVIESWGKKNLLEIITNDSTYAITLVLITIHISIFFIIQKLNKIRLEKICLKGFEINIKNKDSLFSRHLEEIIYFFEATECNCVVIEDIDRFNSIKIFSKLREINTLVNNYPATKNKVKFVYLTRDDILASENLTKFFDYIIPIIPVLSTSNSEKKIKDETSKKGFDLDEKYISVIHNYLSDYRILKNCINESLIYKNEAFIRLSNNSVSQKFINGRIFSLVLYKHLYPLDFSFLQNRNGVLFKCLKEFHYTNSDSKTNDESLDFFLTSDETLTNEFSLEYILNNYRDASYQLKKFIDNLNKKNGYNKSNQINADFIIDLCSHGYINPDDYECYISKTDDIILNKDEQTFLFNVSNNLPNSINLLLNNNHLKTIMEKIKDYQWHSLGILNNKMIDYVITKENTILFSKVTKIIEAMYSFDNQTYENSNQNYFIPQYFTHCKEKGISLDIILEGIANIIITPSYVQNSEKILTLFFINSNTNIFLDFLHKNLSRKLKIHFGKEVSNFLDKKEQFKTDFFNENINNEHFVNDLEKNYIQISLSIELCQLLDEKNLYSSQIYILNKSNLDLILNRKNINTDTPKYLTRCMSINGIKDRFNNSINDLYNNVIIPLKEIDEDYTTLKFIFSNQNLYDNSKLNMLNVAKKTWELYALYCYYVSFDGSLATQIELSFNEKNITTPSNTLFNDDTVIRKFLCSAISYPNYTSNGIDKNLIELFGNYVSILNCFEGEEKTISQLSKEKNELLQEYAISHEKNKSINVLISLTKANPEFFEKNFPEEEYSKESSLQLQFLDTESDALKNIQKKFFEKIQLFPNPNEDKLRYNIYKKAGKRLWQLSFTELNKLSSIAGHSEIAINRLKGINLFSFGSKLVTDAFNFTDSLDNYILSFLDPEAKLLCKTLKYWYVKLCSFVATETFPYKNNQQGLSEFDRKDKNIVSQKNKIFQFFVKNIHLWNNEIQKYLSEK